MCFSNNLLELEKAVRCILEAVTPTLIPSTPLASDGKTKLYHNIWAVLTIEQEKETETKFKLSIIWFRGQSALLIIWSWGRKRLIWSRSRNRAIFRIRMASSLELKSIIMGRLALRPMKWVRSWKWLERLVCTVTETNDSSCRLNEKAIIAT